jgi:hypothetical protein
MMVQLEPEQQNLLVELVEAHRQVPRGKRGSFLMVVALKQLLHLGLRSWHFEAPRGDVEILSRYGLLSVRLNNAGNLDIDVAPEGFAFYAQLKQRSSAPVEQVEDEVRRYLDSAMFADRHSGAQRAWSKAARTLWSTESDDALTDIGHQCREAVQMFGTELVERYKPPKVDPNVQHDATRVASVLDLARSRLSTTEAPFLEALLAYWGAIDDLVQRQEHGAQREGQPLLWEDARRLVFQTAVVMYEVDGAVRRVLG